ncbi:MAG: hypothetical protein FJ398_01590 [Verrucomicrobia bacterium]|nr:hypothetical protein [Verrucomicrobiota bacterium]
MLAHSRVYDWAAVLPDLLADAEVQCFAIEGSFAGLRDWLYYYKPFLHDVGQDGGRDLGIGPPKVTAKELADLAVLFDDWERSRPEPPTLKVLGLDLYPALRNYLKSMVVQMPTLVRHTDAVALRALEVCQPDAVCFFAMPWLPTKRLAFHARQRGIPSVCYQHGACYGTHDVPSHALTEMAHADYFLSYGDGIVPPPNPCLPTRAKYVPVGSARLEALRLHSSSRGPLPFLTALWIGEVSLKNTNGPLEDTKRYLMQRKCLEILGQAAKLRVIYRPFPGELAAQATPRWLELARLPSISVEPNQSLANLMLASDLIICDSTSCNAFNEGVALNKPTILYLDPTQILLLPHFIEDLERACLWCKTDDALINAVRRLAKDPHPFVEELRRIDTTTFMNKYMLHRGGEPCARRVISFLKNVCRDGRSLKQREPMNSATSPGVHTLSDVLSRLNQRLQ